MDPDVSAQRVSQSRLDCGLPTVVYLDHVEQGAHHTVERGQALGPGSVTGLVQRHPECFGPSRPSMAIRGRRSSMLLRLDERCRCEGGSPLCRP
jgi:hypothetical protein